MLTASVLCDQSIFLEITQGQNGSVSKGLQMRTFWYCWSKMFHRMDAFLSPDQQCQSIEGVL